MLIMGGYNVKVLICVDDTDSLDKSTSTGKITGDIKRTIEENNLGVCEDITRHQLLLHPDIPYTSHNSSMCFAAEIDQKNSDEIISRAVDIIINGMADEADPGLCLCSPQLINKNDQQKLINFGQSAQKEVLTKKDAYDLAEVLHIHLSEHGGTGQGIIGALAGVGLRLSGNDGTYKGKLQITASRDDGLVSVDEICCQTHCDEVRDFSGNMSLPKDQLIELGSYAKAVLRDNKKIVLVIPDDNGTYITCSKEQIRGGR